MKNPNGPYPGRQVFLGVTVKGNPAFAYLVTGRSSQSRERKATPKENSIIMGPTGNVPYDPLRHYTAAKWDNEIGLLVVTNGIQTETVFETYKLLYHTASAPNKNYLKKIMDGANYEPDSLKTPRISGVITNPPDKTKPLYHLGIVTHEGTVAWQVQPEAGTFYGVATYHGNMENPGAFHADKGPSQIKCNMDAPEKLAAYLYEISAAMYRGDDIRVCAIGGIRSDNTWKVALINRHQD